MVGGIVGGSVILIREGDDLLVMSWRKGANFDRQSENFIPGCQGRAGVVEIVS